ncbi:MAG: GNAT family N-acetyltransferase [Flavobacterium psychrophilum]|nr:MAG: GNAT family N-acetyltransferase [Flavobacterium psychrophilum]
MQNCILLKADERHVEMLRNLSITTFTATYAQYNTEANMQSYIATEFSVEKLLEVINSTSSTFYFAMEGHEAIGFIKINYAPSQTDLNDPKSLELERIYVSAQHQGKKTGQFLLDAARDIAVKNNFDYLWLGVWDKNTNAQKFYAKNGFIAFGTHDFMLGDDRQKDILLKLQLK